MTEPSETEYVIRVNRRREIRIRPYLYEGRPFVQLESWLLTESNRISKKRQFDIRADLVPELTKALLAAGADGLAMPRDPQP